MTEKELIKKEMTIGEVVQRFPSTADVFMSYGLHCVGCHVSAFETLEQGAAGHGMDAETIKKMVDEANQVANEADKTD